MPYGRDFGVGGVMSLISPVFGSSRPTRLAFCTVNHKIPLWSKISVCGSLASGSGILYSVTAPDFGSSLPTRAPVCPVYQIDPSLVASGSCGRDPGVGTCHSLIETLVGPGITTPTGFSFSGKFLARYSVIVAA